MKIVSFCMKSTALPQGTCDCDVVCFVFLLAIDLHHAKAFQYKPDDVFSTFPKVAIFYSFVFAR